jgi:hypothetical protein
MCNVIPDRIIQAYKHKRIKITACLETTHHLIATKLKIVSFDSHECRFM